MKVIRSSDNVLIKHLGKLRQKKYRYEYEEFVLEGYRLIRDVVSCSSRDSSVKVIISEDKADEYCKEFTDVAVVSDNLFERISDTVNSQGIIAISAMQPFKSAPDSDFCLYLDRVRDPGNLGTIVRTAAACGFSDIVLNDCADIYNPKTIRGSMSAYLYCNFIRQTGEEIPVGKDYTVVCADAKGENLYQSFETLNGKKICLVIGNEAQGIGEIMRRRADVTVSLPMNVGVESLNAAVSASVIMYGLKYFNHI